MLRLVSIGRVCVHLRLRRLPTGAHRLAHLNIQTSDSCTLLNPRQLAADSVVSLNIQTTLLWTTLKQIQLAFVVIIESFVTVLGRNLWFLPAEKIRAVDI